MQGAGMLTLQEVEHSIRAYGKVELGGELSFPIGTVYAEAAQRLQSIANQTGAIVQRGKELGQPMLMVFPVGASGYWRLVWHDRALEITRYTPETKLFNHNLPAPVHGT